MSADRKRIEIAVTRNANSSHGLLSDVLPPLLEEVPKAVGRSIAGLRCAQGLSQKDLADACGLSVSAISLIENGERSNLSTLDRISRKLGLRWIGDLFRFVEEYGSKQALERNMRKRGVQPPTANAGRKARAKKV